MNEKVFIIGAEENPCLPFIHSLSKKGIEIHVGSYRIACPGFFSRFVVKRHRYPPPDNEDDFIDAILKIIKKEYFTVTLVFGELNSYLITKHKQVFIPYTKLPINDFDTYMKCRNKKNIIKIAKEVGVPTPLTYFPEEEDIKEIAKKVSYPCVLKPNMSYGARGMSFPTAPEELIRMYKITKEEYGECHVQEYIPPGGGQFKAEIMQDIELNLVAWCAYEKIRFYPPKGGSSTFNRTVWRPDILQMGAKILKAIGWKGIGDCDFIYDPRDNVPKLMEINARITRSIKICCLAGVDFPYLLYKMAIGDKLEPILKYKENIYMQYLFADILWFLKANNKSFGFLQSLFKGIPEEIFSLKDPFPFIGFSLGIAKDMLNKKQRKKRLR